MQFVYFICYILHNQILKKPWFLQFDWGVGHLIFTKHSLPRMPAWKFIPKSFWSLPWYQYSCCSQLCSNCSNSKVGILWPHLPTKLGHFLSLVTIILSAFPLHIPLPFKFSWPVPFCLQKPWGKVHTGLKNKKKSSYLHHHLITS